MSETVSRLSSREREVLRLLARGHDGKSSAAALGISINSVNERLRDARRKLGVSSSRKAARMLSAHEAEGDNFPGHKEVGLDRGVCANANGRQAPRRKSAAVRRNWLFAGGISMLILFGSLTVLSLGTPNDAPPLLLSSGSGAAPVVTLPVPSVVSTSPPSGSAIKPGPLELSVTFNMPMQEGSYSFVRSSTETYPDCASQPVLSNDRRTFKLRCKVLPNRRYEIWFNRPPYMNFKSASGVPAQPSRLLFRTHAR